MAKIASQCWVLDLGICPFPCLPLQPKVFSRTEPAIWPLFLSIPFKFLWWQGKLSLPRPVRLRTLWIPGRGVRLLKCNSVTVAVFKSKVGIWGGKQSQGLLYTEFLETVLSIKRTDTVFLKCFESDFKWLKLWLRCSKLSCAFMSASMVIKTGWIASWRSRILLTHCLSACAKVPGKISCHMLLYVGVSAIICLFWSHVLMLPGKTLKYLFNPKISYYQVT